MDHLCNLVYHENKLELIGNTVKNDQKSPNLSPYRRLLVNNFALIHYCRLKFVHKVDIIIWLMDHVCNLVHHENKFK